MNKNKRTYYHVINNLESKYAPNERMQLFICSKGVTPPSKYLFYPNIPKDCELAAQLNLSRIKNKLSINKMKIYNKTDCDFLIPFFIERINQYAISHNYKYIYTTNTQYNENNLGSYGFKYYEPLNLYRRMVINK